MKCILSGANARVFAKAIQSLARIGSELFMEADDDGLSIRSISSSKSAFALIRFHPEFFTDYDVGINTEDEFANKCKVSMKACIGTFKNMKQVELCKISIDSPNSRLIVELKCRLETMKTHSISILDFETLEAVYMTDNAPNKLTASHKLFGEISNNFQMNEEEITLEAAADNLTVKNYVEGSRVDRRFMRSQLLLKSEEFQEYGIREETSITFCLREFRALLGFAEAINIDMTVNFEIAGRPVVFILKNMQFFEANLVMSTLSPDDFVPFENTLLNASNASNSKRISESIDLSGYTEPTNKRTRHNNDKEHTLKESEIFNLPRNSELESIDLIRENSQANIETQISLPAATTRESTQSNLVNKQSEGICITFKDTEELYNEDSVPKSPNADRRKRTRVVFRRCFEETFDPEAVVGTSRILARSSDNED